MIMIVVRYQICFYYLENFNRFWNQRINFDNNYLKSTNFICSTIKSLKNSYNYYYFQLKILAKVNFISRITIIVN